MQSGPRVRVDREGEVGQVAVRRGCGPRVARRLGQRLAGDEGGVERANEAAGRVVAHGPRAADERRRAAAQERLREPAHRSVAGRQPAEVAGVQEHERPLGVVGDGAEVGHVGPHCDRLRQHAVVLGAAHERRETTLRNLRAGIAGELALHREIAPAHQDVGDRLVDRLAA